MEYLSCKEDNPRRVQREARKPLRKSKSCDMEAEPNMTGIFDIEGAGYDVVLEREKIVWTPVNVMGKGSKTKKSKASIIKRLRGCKANDSYHSNSSDASNGLQFKDIIGIKIKRQKKDSHKEGQGVCVGMEIHIHDRKGPNRFKDRALLLGHPSEEICVLWMNKIKEGLEEFTDRPKKLKVFLQPYAGKKQGKQIYSTKIKPLFEAADIEIDLTEVEHNEHIKQQFIHMNLQDYDSIVCIGGDGTVHKVMNGLLNKVQQDEGSDMVTGQPLHRSQLPLGIIPTGLINQIAHSVHGIEDPITAAIHIILGHRKPVNVCAIYHKDRLHRWAFNAHYGFFGDVIPFLGRHSTLGEKKIEYAVLRALTKKRFRSYEGEVQYIDAGTNGDAVTKGDPCTSGCSTCEVDALGLSQLSTFSDDVQELDPLAISSTSSTIIDLSNEVPWKSLKGEFVDIGMFSLPGLCNISPRGASPYTHVNDGYLDLIIIRPTARKEFVRYLRRHGNAKNQFDFPFVETVRCKEVNFHIRLKETWNHKDYGFNEIDYEMERQVKQQKPGLLSRSKSIDVIEELCMEYSDEDEEEQNEMNISNEEGSELDEATISGNNSTENVPGRPSSVYRPTYQEMERLRRRKRQQQKDEKKKAEAEASMKSLWNLDNEACLELDLEFRMHRNIMCIYGLGVSQETQYEETKYNCLSMMK